MTTTPMTHNLEIRHTYTPEEITARAKQLSEEFAIVDAKISELEALKARFKNDKDELDDQIGSQQVLIRELIECLAQGFEVTTKECSVKYENGETISYDKDTGEELERRPMTEGEQTRLTEHRIDAEDLIRQARENDE